MSVRINKGSVDRMFKKLNTLPQHTIKKSGQHFKKITPVDTGNAQRKTRTAGNQIKAEYGYAARLDEGWSKQAPDGMSDPTIDKMDDIITDFVRGL